MRSGPVVVRRVSEACSIDIEDLSLERGHRTVTVLGKGSKLAVIPLPPRIGRAVDLAAGERASGPLLLTQAGNRMNRHAATRIVHRLAKRAGITKHISPHSLRHSFITAALDAGVPLRDVQIAARHADPRTTTRYDRARTIWTAMPAASSPLSWREGADRSDIGHGTGADGCANGPGVTSALARPIAPNTGWPKSEPAPGQDPLGTGPS